MDVPFHKLRSGILEKIKKNAGKKKNSNSVEVPTFSLLKKIPKLRTKSQYIKIPCRDLKTVYSNRDGSCRRSACIRDSSVPVGEVIPIKGDNRVVPVIASAKRNYLPAEECSTMTNSDVPSDGLSELFSDTVLDWEVERE